MKNLFSLEGKIIVITGAVGLLGLEYCKAIINAKGTPILVDINEKLLKSARKSVNYFMLSTGMSTEQEIDRAVELGNPNLIFHLKRTAFSQVLAFGEDRCLRYKLVKQQKNCRR